MSNCLNAFSERWAGGGVAAEVRAWGIAARKNFMEALFHHHHRIHQRMELGTYGSDMEPEAGGQLEQVLAT